MPSPVPLGKLSFSGAFSQSGTKYTAAGGDVLVGLTPSSGGAFVPLLDFNLQSQATLGVLSFDTTDATNFQFSRAAVASIVQGRVGAPTIWQTAPDDPNPTKWSVAQLTGSAGQSVSGGQPFTALSASFTLTDLILATKDGNTDHAEVKMQGSVTFSPLATLDLSRVQASVDGSNYLIADSSGISLTGLTASLTGSASFDIFGITATLSSPSITYSDNNDGQDTFKFSIGASISTNAQDGGQHALDKVGAGLSVTLTGTKPNQLSLTQIGFDQLQASFQLFGVQVATDPGNPLSIQYNFDNTNHHEFDISGGLTVSIPTATESTVDVVLGIRGVTTTGIVIQDGALTSLHADILADFSLAGLKITDPNRLNLIYDRNQDQFEVFGGVTLSVPTKAGGTTSISANLGNQDNPGLEFAGGHLQELNITLSGQFDLFGLTIQVTDAGVQYDATNELYKISGTVKAPQLWNAAVSLGTETQPGIVIQDGHFQLHNFSIGLSDVNLGAFTLQQLQVKFSQSSPAADFDLTVSVFVTFPSGWGVGGSVTLDNGQVDDISLFYSAGTSQGIAVGDTGLYLTYLEGSVQNIDDPHDLIVSGNVAFTYGSSITIYDPLQGHDITATLFAASGGFLVDRNQLVLNGSFYLGAYSGGTGSNGEPLYKSALGEDDSASMDLDWGARQYSVTASLSLYGGVIKVQGAFAFDQTGDIVMAARASLKVPSEIPFIGGDTIGSADFLFEYHPSTLDSSFFAAWTEFTIPVIDKHIKLGLKYDIRHSDLSLLSGDEIDAFDGCFNDPAQCLSGNGLFSYFDSYTRPAGATSATLSVSWPHRTASSTSRSRCPTARRSFSKPSTWPPCQSASTWRRGSARRSRPRSC